ncbi:glycerophosphodiester phosphodiesterase family protein [Flavobacterium sp. N502536]|uniref:glycerophosphodiester phosphodiesterase family protein n=1 Tax=Flavobacterium sp. N502536 TaxID=2986837 RepID=UPI0022227933|nr:glycerophosphodiester phosphodiesterase family protein [Flavobacterium sp. N502536]
MKVLFRLLEIPMLSTVLILLMSLDLAGQTIVGSRVFTSPEPGINGATISDMVTIDRDSLFGLKQNVSGIIATMNAPTGKVTVTANSYNLDGTNRVLWRCTSTQTSTVYSGQQDFFVPPGYGFGQVGSMQSKILGMNDFANSYTPPGIMPLKEIILVTVEVSITDATFVKAYIPGIGEYTLDFPWTHACFGKTTVECQALREFRNGDMSKVIVTAHRGYWGYGNIAEGGMQSLLNAYQNNYLFVELDIMQSKDKNAILLHDQEVNRMTNLPPTPDNDEQAWIRNLNFNSTTMNIPKRGGGSYPSYPELKTGFLVDRRGEVTLDPLNELSVAMDYLVDKSILIQLDIKDKYKEDYLLTTYLCLKEAKDKGVLHKMMFKPGSAAPVSRQEIQDYLTHPDVNHPENLWSEFAYQTSSVVIILPTDVDSPFGDSYIVDSVTGTIIWDHLKIRLDDWMQLPSVVSFEVIFKCEETDPLLTAGIPAQGSIYNGRSIAKYMKDNSYRTGINWEIPCDCRGTSNGRGKWFDKNQKVEKPYLTYSPNCYDLRSNPEWLMNPPGYSEDIKPGSIVTDRPDVFVNMLKMTNSLNPVTFRQ